jgi:GT2 family glycosyltransferase
MTATPDLARTDENTSAGAALEPARPAGPLPLRIDFAELIHPYLVIFGWILGFPKSVESASIQFGELTIDLRAQARRVPRPDVANHFKLDPKDDEHGVYCLIELPGSCPSVDDFALTIVLPNGVTEQSRWPVRAHAAITDSIIRPYLANLKLLLLNLPPYEGRRLSRFLTPPVMAEAGLRFSAKPPAPIQFHVDFCGVLEDRFLVVSISLFDPAREIESVRLTLGALTFDLLAESARVPGSGANAASMPEEGSRNQSVRCLFCVKPIDRSSLDEGDAEFVLGMSNDAIDLKHAVLWDPQVSREELLLHLDKMDADATLQFTDQFIAAIAGSPRASSLSRLLRLKHDRAVEQLPHFIESSQPKFEMHIDLAIPAAKRGLYLSGWVYADSGLRLRITCHEGSASHRLDDGCISHMRRDVVTYLAGQGISADDQELGFSCYVPLHFSDGPIYLSVETPSGEVKRMRVQVPETVQPALQALRALLSSFTMEHRNLREFLDQQAGPAVKAIWSARSRPTQKTFVQSFGDQSQEPCASIVVPLYGRHDLARYQLALFAGDPDLRDSQLIYVVDDPAIFDEFRMACPDLFEIYRVPFTVVASGANLGYAGANNLGVEFARAPHLLLLNSDVMPKKAGWLGELLRVYRSLDAPGLVGTKLIYEDGSLQHAGMVFRRYAPWANLWINDHPWKGLNPSHLEGTCEVEAVTAACVLIETDLYRKLGGFSEDYVIGDFEDSDLCLRARLAGRRNYVARDIELYHLERQSQGRIGDNRLRTNLTLYNCWVFNQRWSHVIANRDHSQIDPNESRR